MSRIGKKPIQIPPGVTVRETDGIFYIKGPKGELEVKAIPGIAVSFVDLQIICTPMRESKKSGALWGLARALIANAVMGVTEGFQKKLEIQGIGYRAEAKGKEIIFNLGFSHPVSFHIPETINVVIEKNIITVSGVDRALVGETAAKIRLLKKPEPYKGKGIRYFGEIVKIKAGKKAVGSATGAA